MTQVIANLTKRGYVCSIPLADDLPFDLIVINTETYNLYKLQVKHRKISGNGIIIPLTTVYSTKKGNKTSPYNLSDFDYFAVYNPDTDMCYYVSTKEIIERGTTTGFKLSTTKSERDDFQRMAENYLNFNAV